MAQRLIIAFMALAIVSVIGIGLIDAANADISTTQDAPALAAEATAAPTAEIPPIPDTPAPEVTPETAAPTESLASEEAGASEEVGASDNPMGDPWIAEGSIVALEDFGFTLNNTTGSYFVELGPPTYWQAQGMTLSVGDTVSVEGYYNGEQAHAFVVTTADGAELVIRNESGQPMWAGGASGEGSGEGGAGSIQVTPEDWLTLSGMIGSVSNGQVTLNVNDGTVVALQMGQRDFWQGQGVTLSVGDAVEVLGFWSGEQFMAGDVRKTATGETIILRDPNGRQLWGGPGRSGGGGGNGNGGSGNGNGGGGSGNGNGNADTHSDTGETGTKGNQYRGGRSTEDQ